MKKIGFKNFRRFQTFEPLEYRGITFLVGRNNAGKSTLVKALLLIDNYFKSRNIDTLAFGNNILEDANIVNYGRAKNFHANENFIHFTQEIENYLIELTVTGEDDKAYANVHTLTITDLGNNLSFIFNLQNRNINIFKGRKQQDEIESRGFISNLETKINGIKKQLEESELKKTSKEYIELVSSLENYQIMLKNLNQNLINTNKNNVIFSLDEDFGNVNSFTEIVQDMLLQLNSQYEIEFRKLQNGETPSEKFEELRALKVLGTVFVESSLNHFMDLMNDFSISYMGANSTKQSALFAIRDKNNALAQAIHEYKQLNIADGEEEHRFVLKWMHEFEVGDDFVISMHAGEAYEMKIRSNNTQIHLADKGMGSIQAMLLIMRLACIIKRIRNAEKNSTITRIVVGKEVRQDSSNYRLIDKTTVIIEEPELNLHPALQSKLADLFLYVNQPPFNLNFIIETHSEYILRRSQVIVAENELEVAPNENPFCVYYFPDDLNQQPYRLDYEPNGRFNKNFGNGFFNEATKSTMALLKPKTQS